MLAALRGDTFSVALSLLTGCNGVRDVSSPHLCMLCVLALIYDQELDCYCAETINFEYSSTVADLQSRLYVRLFVNQTVSRISSNLSLMFCIMCI